MATLDTILNIKVEGTSQMVQLKDAIDKTSKELKDLKKESKQAGADQKKYNAEIVTAETKLKGLRSELNGAKNEMIKNAKAAGDTSKSYNSLTKQNASLVQKLKALKDPLGKNNAEFKKLSAQINKNTNELKQMDAAMGRQQRNVGNYKQAIGQMATAVGGAILAFQAMKQAISIFTDFEFQVKQLGVISGATVDELASLEEQAKELGRTTTFTAGEVAGFQVELAKLGFDPTQIENMTQSVLDLSFAFGEDLATTGEQVGIVLKSFQLDASETARVTDVMAAAFSQSSLDLTKFSTAMPKVAAVANQLGFTLEGTTALLGKLSDAGLDASTAGTSLRNIFLKLADPTSELSVALGGGVDSVDELLPALKELEDQGIKVADMLELTDKRSVPAFATLIQGADDVATLNENLLNAEGTTAKFAETMNDSLKGSFAELTSATQGLIIEFVDELAPAITLIVDGFSGFFGLITKTLPFLKKLALGFVAYKTAVLAAKIQQLGFKNALISSRIGMVAYNTTTKGATMATRAFNTAIRSNPLGLLIGGLTMAAAHLMDFAFAADDTVEDVDDLNESLEEEVTTLGKLVDAQEKGVKLSEDLMKKEHEQIAEVQLLKRTIEDVTKATEDREKALKSFNEIAGTNIQNLEDEKTLTNELQKAYEDVVTSIKQKIIIQSAEEQMTGFITRQIELEKEVNGTLERQLELENDITVTNEKQNQKTIKQLKETGELQLENFSQFESSLMVIDGQMTTITKPRKLNFIIDPQASNTLESFNTILDENIKKTALRNQFNEIFISEEQAAFTQIMNSYGHLDTAQSNFMTGQAEQIARIQTTALKTELLNKSLTDLNNGIDWNKLKEDLTMGLDEESQRNMNNFINSIDEQKRKQIELGLIMVKQNDAAAENAEIESELATLLDLKGDAMDVLNKLIKSNTSSSKKERTEYQLLKDAVNEQEQALTNLIAEKNREKLNYLQSIEDKNVSDEERNRKLEEIEDSYAEKVDTATDKVIDARNDLKKVENEVLEVYQKIDEQTTNLNDKSLEYVKATNEQIAADKAQLKSWEELEKAGANIAEERIRLALKIAKAELELALVTIKANEDTTQAQIDNINQLKIDIGELETSLKNFSKTASGESGDGGDGSTVGFMQRAIFGTKDGEEPITGEDFVDALNVTFNQVGEIMSAFNELQNQQLNTELGYLEEDKAAAVKEFEESNEFAIMSDEQRAEKILEIEEGFDDRMLKLKRDQFKKDQQFKENMAIMSGAQAIMNILAGEGTGNVILDGILKAMMIATTIATTAIQIATIRAAKPPTAELGGIMDDSFFARGGMVHGRSHAQGGEKFGVGGRVVELEGGEAVINKRSTAMFKPILSQMNVAGGGRKFADGGMIFDTDTMSAENSMFDNIVANLNAQRVYLVESDVTRSQKTVKTIESRVTF